MAQTLEEFLVNVKYSIDEPSQAKFFDSLKRAATSVAGIAGQLVGLGVAILALSERMAETGSKMYWMSQRTGESVKNIQDMSAALTDLGLSGQHAAQALDALTNYTNTRGPAATAYLRALGVTAAGANEQLRQLGQRLLQSGPQGSIQYAIELNRMRSMGLDETTLRRMGSPEYGEALKNQGIIRQAVWGKDADKGPALFATQADKVMVQFNKMGSIFDNLTQRFGLGLFNKIMPELERINRLLIANLPKIQGFLDQMISAAPAVLHFLEGAIKGFGNLLMIGTQLFKTFQGLPDVLQAAIAAFFLLPKAFSLMTSPLFLMLAGLTTLMLLLDDYQHWQDDQKHPDEEPTSHFDWGKTDTFLKGLGDNPILQGIAESPIYKTIKAWNDQLSNFITGVTGIPKVLEGVEAALVLLMAKEGFKLLFSLMTGWVGSGAKAAGGVAAGLVKEAGAAVASALLENAALAAMASAAVPVLLGAGIIALLVGAVYELLRTVLPALFGERPTELDRKPVGRWVTNWYTGQDEWVETPQTQANTSRGQSAQPEGRARNQGINARPGHGPAKLPSWWPKSLGGEGGDTSATGEQHSSITSKIPGSYQVAGDNWAGVAPSGNDDADRFFEMLKKNLETMVEKLSELLDATINIGKASGALTPGGSSAGGGGSSWSGDVNGGDADAGAQGSPAALGMTPEQYDTFRKTLGARESGNRYNIRNSSGFSGKYQFGAPEIRETARRLGEQPPSIQQFLHDPAMQERYMLAYTTQHHQQMMRDPAYRALSPADQGGYLGAAHLSGVGGALNLLHGGGIRRDGNRTSNADYRDMLARALRNSLGHQPLGVDARRGGLRNDIGGRGVNVHNSTSIAITAPSPASAARQVAEVMPNIYRNQLRFSKGALLA